MTDFCGDDAELLSSVSMRKYFGQLKIRKSTVKMYRIFKSVSYVVSWLVSELSGSLFSPFNREIYLNST